MLRTLIWAYHDRGVIRDDENKSPLGMAQKLLLVAGEPLHKCLADVVLAADHELEQDDIVVVQRLIFVPDKQIKCHLVVAFQYV
jgi:hypothetical protein